MAFARWDTIAQRILANLQDAGVRNYTREQILSRCTQIEQDVARDGLALEGTHDITTIVNTASYAVPAGVWRIDQIIRPDDWHHPIEIVQNKKRWEYLNHASTHWLNVEQPLAARVFNGNLEFIPAPTDVQTVTLETFDIPDTAPDFGADPELAAEWDDSIIYGCTAQLLMGKDAKAGMAWLGLYTGEVKKQGTRKMKGAVLSPLTVEHSSDKLGF